MFGPIVSEGRQNFEPDSPRVSLIWSSVFPALAPSSPESKSAQSDERCSHTFHEHKKPLAATFRAEDGT
jgi:hypothetical protein